MARDIIDGDLLVKGNLQAGTMTISADSVGDEEMNVADPIGVDKQRHQYALTFSQVHASAATAERRVLHVANGAGELDTIVAGITVATVGDSTVTVNFYKNGSTILSAPIVIDTNVAYAEEAGTFASAPYSAGDVFEVVVTVAANTGTLPRGLYVSVIFDEEQA